MARWQAWQLAGALLAAVGIGPVMAQDMPPEVEALQTYLVETEYLELFGEDYYRIDIENVILDDVDGDGRQDAIVHTRPHFRQSATILFYSFGEDGRVERAFEGLAPGPLVPATLQLLDTHIDAEGVDISVGDPPYDISAQISFAIRASRQFGGVVVYDDFIHVDPRAGSPFYIDMTGRDGVRTLRDCSEFEFSDVRQIQTGLVPALDEGRILAAWAGDRAYLYLIRQLRPDAPMTKTVWEAYPPSGASELGHGPDDALVWVLDNGATLPVTVEAAD